MRTFTSITIIVTRMPPYSCPSRMASTRTDSATIGQTVFRRMDLAQRDEDPLQGLGGCVSESEQVDVLRRPDSLAQP